MEINYDVNTLRQRQAEREKARAIAKKAKWEKKQQKARNSEQDEAMNALLDDLQDKVVTTLHQTIAEKQHMKKTMVWIPAVERLNLFVAAYHGLNVLMECAKTHAEKSKAAIMIGDRLAIEAMGQILRDRDQLIDVIRKEYIKQFIEVPDEVMQRANALGITSDDLYQNVNVKSSLAKRTEKHGRKHMRRPVSKRMSLEYTLKRLGLAHELWDATLRGHVGGAVLSAVTEATSDSVFETWPKAGYIVEPNGYRRRVLRDVWGFKAKYIDWLDRHKNNKLKNWMKHEKVHLEELPNLWADGDGPYNTRELNNRTPIIRGIPSRRRDIISRYIDRGNMPKVTKALDAVQRTRFEINPVAVEIMNWLEAEGLKPDGFPTLNKFKVPELAANDNESDDEKAKHDRRKRRDVLIRNREVDSNVVNFREVQDRMAELLELPCGFFIPTTLDFRGRHIPDLQPNFHAADYIRACFTLANKKPVGEDGTRWLMIQTATLGDWKVGDSRVSKMSFMDRLNWTADHLDDIIYPVAKDFRSTYDIWSQADKPIQFVLACIETRNAIEQGNDYLCGLPVSIDGSNSALQHLAAASRDAKTAALVNLVPNDKPADVYQFVAEKVEARVKAILDHANDNEPDDVRHAENWLAFGITRSVCKRPVMVFGYNSKPYGFAKQICEDTMDPLYDKVLSEELEQHPFGDDKGKKAARFLANHLWAVVNTELSGPAEAMRFLKGCVKALAHNTVPVTDPETGKLRNQAKPKHFQYVNQLGFPMTQEYSVAKKNKIRPYMFCAETRTKRRQQITIAVEADEVRVHTKRAMNGVAANHTHQADAQHLALSVCKALDQGICDFFLIHDSFGCLPADMPVLFDVVREAFVELYDGFDVWGDVEKQTIERLHPANSHRSEKHMEDQPNRGDFDVTQVRKSPYCFA